MKKILAAAAVALGIGLTGPAHAENLEATGLWRLAVTAFSAYEGGPISAYTCTAQIRPNGAVRGSCAGGVPLRGRLRVNQLGIGRGKLVLRGVATCPRIDIGFSDNTLTGIVGCRGDAGFAQVTGVRLR